MFNFGGCTSLLLNGFLKTKRLSHAYLFCGEEFVGKKLVARNFAMAIFCCNDEKKPCFECEFCRKFLNKNLVDYFELLGDETSKSGVISVQQVRQLIFDAFVKPIEGQFKIFLINRVDELLPSAANAILKLIEEPPKNVIFLLTAASRLEVLPTIVSRCVLVNVFGEGTKDCFNLLKSSYSDLGEAKLCQAVCFAEGSFERAKLILEDSEWQNASEMAKGLFDAYVNRNELQFLQLIARVERPSKLVFVVFKFFTINLSVFIRQKLKLNRAIDLQLLTEFQRVFDCFESAKFLILRNCNLKLVLTDLCCSVFSK